MSDGPRDLSSDPFLADLVAGLDPGAASGEPTDHVPAGEGWGVGIRRDAHLAVVQAWAPGPAGVASLELDHGITVVVDAALPHRFVGATIVPPDTDAIRRLDPLLGPRAVDGLVDAGSTGGEWRPVRARPRETTDSVAIGRYALLADEAAHYHRAYPSPVARVAFLVELAAVAPCSLAALLGDRLLEWGREAAEAMIDLEESGRIVIPTGTAAHRLANALREVEVTIDRVSERGANPLAYRRFARQLPPLAERIEDGRYIDQRTTEPDEPTGEDLSEDDPAVLGRAACRHERQHDEPAAAMAWDQCAEQWAALDDEDRAETARLFGRGLLGDAGPIVSAPAVGDRGPDRVRVRSRRSDPPARFGWIRNRDIEPEPVRPVTRRSRHEVSVREEMDRFSLLTPFLADDLS